MKRITRDVDPADAQDLLERVPCTQSRPLPQMKGGAADVETDARSADLRRADERRG